MQVSGQKRIPRGWWRRRETELQVSSQVSHQYEQRDSLWFYLYDITPLKKRDLKLTSHMSHSMYTSSGEIYHSCGEKEYKSERTRAAFITLLQKPHTVTFPILNHFIHSWILLRLICTTVLTFKCLTGQCENLDIIHFLRDSNLKYWKIWNAIFFLLPWGLEVKLK